MELFELGKQGPAWVLLLATVPALCAVIAILYRQLTKERETCSNDWRTVVAGNTLQMKEWSAANEPRTRALEANVRALDLMTVAINQLTAEIAQNREVMLARAEEAIQSNRNMREALLKKGVDL